MRQSAVIGVLSLCALWVAPRLLVAATPVDKPPVRASLDLNDLKRALESGDEARALAALDEIEQAGDRGAEPLVEGMLSRGASPKLLLRAIAVAGSLGKESASAALAPYVKHRSSDVRRAAAQSLLRTKGKVAVQALRDALRGSDPVLRGIAAQGLGVLGAREAVPDLFVVLPKEVPEAAAALGLLCTGDECRKFLSFLGRLPFELMESGFLPLLQRSAQEVPDDAKLQLIEQLRRMATAKASEVLVTALATYPAGGSPKIKAALDAANHGHSVKGEEP